MTEGLAPRAIAFAVSGNPGKLQRRRRRLAPRIVNPRARGLTTLGTFRAHTVGGHGVSARVRAWVGESGRRDIRPRRDRHRRSSLQYSGPGRACGDQVLGCRRGFGDRAHGDLGLGAIQAFSLGERALSGALSLHLGHSRSGRRGGGPGDWPGYETLGRARPAEMGGPSPARRLADPPGAGG